MAGQCKFFDWFRASFLFVAVLNLSAKLSAAPSLATGEEIWQELKSVPTRALASEPWIRPPISKTYQLAPSAFQESLQAIPMEVAGARVSASPILFAVPRPDGKFERFAVVESPVMAPELAAKFPEIRTFVGQGVDDPYATIRFDWTPQGFHAQVRSPHGSYSLDPHTKSDNTIYSSYFRKDYVGSGEPFVCAVEEGAWGQKQASAPPSLMSSGPTRRDYRLACAATGEYTAYHGGTVGLGLAAIVTAINRVTGIYETDACIRMTLVANNNLIVYTNGGADPYTNGNVGLMVDENQANLDAVILSANYDIGHVVGNGGGGLAFLACVCNAGDKALGATGLTPPIGDTFYVDYISHEIGHQFNAGHTFNGLAGFCGGNRMGASAMEPGSGSTILSYSGICGSDDLQSSSGDYFHSISYDQIIAYSTISNGNACPIQVATGNSPPTVNAGPNYTIPRSTPFILTATANDPNSDSLTYCWEERDLGPAQSYPFADNGSSPLFRSFDPDVSPTRIFPKLTDILNNTTTIGEQLPTTSRVLKFRVMVRDNNAGGGGVDFDDMTVTISSGGPFQVIYPNSSATLDGPISVNWQVGGSNLAPVSAASVNILLSTDGGLTFPTTLAAATPNDGTEVVLLPNITTSTARIKIEAVGNIFFDISNPDFGIQPHVNRVSDWEIYS